MKTKKSTIKLVDRERKYKNLLDSEETRLKELGLSEDKIRKVDGFIDSVRFNMNTYKNNISIRRARRLLGVNVFISSILHCMYYGRSMRSVEGNYILMTSTNINSSAAFNALAKACNE